jgi:hypothetical protein
LVEGLPDREATEEIENQVLTREEIEEGIDRGLIRDGKTLVGLYA